MKRLFSFFAGLALLGVNVISVTAVQAASIPDGFYSTMAASKTQVRADGIDAVTLTVTVKDANLMALENIPVTIASTRGTQDEIIVDSGTTDLLGKARFRVHSLRNGTSVFTATAGSVTLLKQITVEFKDGLTIPINVGDLIKIPDDNDANTLNDTAVYYYASNGKRYVFPNEKVYFTWYPDFNNVKIIPIDQMSLIPIGGNVTYKPGSKLVKFQTDTKTYIVTRGGVLRWAMTEDVVRGWFGPNWNQYVDDISEAFYVNYKFGTPVGNSLDLALDIVRAGTSSIDQDKGLLIQTYP